MRSLPVWNKFKKKEKRETNTVNIGNRRKVSLPLPLTKEFARIAMLAKCETEVFILMDTEKKEYQLPFSFPAAFLTNPFAILPCARL